VKITIESTTQITIVAAASDHVGIPCRVWEGETANGVKVQVLIPRIAAKDDQDLSQFEAELIEQRPPSDETLRAFPLRMIL
jgi:hypothetical protein